MQIDVEQIGRRLQEAGPKAPPLILGPDQPREAAVFALLVSRPELSLVLIKRAERGDPWSGQVAFPGGRLDPEDESPLAAAYREAAEEIGVAPPAIQYHGPLGKFLTLSGSVLVHAFLGSWDGVGPLRPAPAEVAAIVECPLATLWTFHNREGFAGQAAEDLGTRLAYPSPAGLIWGVTARMIHHLLETLAPLHLS
jgi:8-oxo-dGTP pyrophosphatase MutT (NUDIX family)